MTDFDNLLKVIKAHLLSEKLEDIELNGLYELSNALNVSSFVSYELKRNGISDKRFESVMYGVLRSYERLKSVKDKLKETLDGEYIFLKGETIARLYDEPYLRNSSDLDIVASINSFEKVKKTLIELGYKVKKDTMQESALSLNGISIDLHRTFLPEEEKQYERFFKNKFNSNHELSLIDTYLFFIIHTAKHVKLGQLDLRVFSDLYYLNKSIDKESVEPLIKEAGLYEFYLTLNSYLECIVSNKQKNKTDELYEKFLLSYSKDMGANNRVLFNRDNTNTISYIFKRIFLPKEEMAYEYPVLNKCMVLLPLCYIRRIVRILKSNRKDFALNEMKNNVSVKKEDLIAMKRFKEDLGL